MLRPYRLAAVFLLTALPSFVFAQDIGLSALQARLGNAAPNGAGVSVMQVEVGTNYKPDTTLTDFSGKTFTFVSEGGGPGSHATDVGVRFYGNTAGVASGVTNIFNFRVSGIVPDDWLGGAYLNMLGPAPVERANLRVQNHSWIGNFQTTALDQEALRRYDFALRRDNALGVHGVNNGTATPIPSLLGNSYNGIAVGNTIGNSSWGPSTLDVPGRSKPDIVAPEGATSLSTPTVAGVGAILIQTADQMGGGNAGRIETIKSTLLTGATKDEFIAQGTPWSRVSNGSWVEPLDRRFGAGEVNVNNSHLVLTAGEKNGADLSLDGDRGWDFETMTGEGSVRRYFFDLADLQNVRFSATATWLRRITPTGSGVNVFETSDATLSTVELRLFEANPDFSLGALVDSSVSPIDNVQHLFQFNLPGSRRYALEVLLADLPGGQGSENVAVSWFTNFTAVPEPGTYALLVFLGAAAVSWHSRRRLPAAAEEQ
jgi:hypothetical protein